jgi:hypothetical protein
MNFRKTTLYPRVLISVGLLFVTIPQLLIHYFQIPDFVHGSLIGIGLGLEIWGLVRMRQIRRSRGLC